MNQIYSLLIATIIISSCNGQEKKQIHDESIHEPTSKTLTTDTTSLAGKKIRCLLQDKTGKIWFATDGNGICSYDGKSLTWFTIKDGLCSNYAWTIQEDKTGNLWLGTSNGVCRFDGKSFTSFTKTYGLTTYGYGPAFDQIRGNLWFGANGGVYGFNGKSFAFFPLPGSDIQSKFLPGPQPGQKSPYTAYCFLEDRAGNLWFGTEQKGVCRYDGKSFTWFTGTGLDNGAVRCIYQDKKGKIWIGSNGGGVSLFDGKSFTNFSEDKGLSHSLAGSRLEDETQKLNRVWSITEDKSGNIWFGTIDEGAWRYDGKSLFNYSVKDGLSSNAVWAIFRDRSEKIWFGTDGGGVCQYDGSSFIKFKGLSF